MKKKLEAKREWLKVTAEADYAKMVISGPIGNSLYDPGTSSKEFCQALDSIDANTPVKVYVNSEGGSVHAAVEMYEALKARGNVTCIISGVALSAASIVALGGERVISPESAVWMIHTPRVGTFGDEAEHQKSIKLLQAFAKSMCAVYASETGHSEEEIMDLMEAETWFTGSEAVEFGLADAMDDNDETEEEAAYASRAEMVLAIYRPPKEIRTLLQIQAIHRSLINVPISAAKSGSGASPAAGKTTETETDMGNETKNPAVAAVTPPAQNNPDPNLARFIEERKARISAEVNKRAEGRIKNDNLEWWINAALNANTLAEENAVYAQIEAMPKPAPAGAGPLPREGVPNDDVLANSALPSAMGTCYSKSVDKVGHIVEIGTAPSRPRPPFAQEIRKLKSPAARAEAMKRDWAGLLNYCIELDMKATKEGKLPVAANSFSSTLITDNLVDTAITILINTWASLSCFTRDFSVDRYKPLATAQIKFVSAGATTLVGTKSSNITSFESGDSTVVPITVALNHYSQPFHVGQDEMMSGLRLENLLQINLGTLANTITLAALQPLATGALNSSGNTVAYSAGTYFASASAGTFGWTNDMPRLRGYLKKSPLKNAVLDGAFYSFLTNQPGFFQPTSVGPRGDRVSTFGWNEINENSIWPTLTNTLGGFICNPSAIGVVAGLPQLQPNIPGNVLTETVINIPGPDIFIANYMWFSLASRTLWCSYDVMFGSAGGDASAGALLFNGSGPRS